MPMAPLIAKTIAAASVVLLLTKVVDWRLAIGAGLLVWLGAALVYLQLAR